MFCIVFVGFISPIFISQSLIIWWRCQFFPHLLLTPHFLLSVSSYEYMQLYIKWTILIIFWFDDQVDNKKLHSIFISSMSTVYQWIKRVLSCHTRWIANRPDEYTKYTYSQFTHRVCVSHLCEAVFMFVILNECTCFSSCKFNACKRRKKKTLVIKMNIKSTDKARKKSFRIEFCRMKNVRIKTINESSVVHQTA